MSVKPPVLAAVLLALGSSCVLESPRAAQEPETPGDPSGRPPAVVIGAFYVPALNLSADEDPGERNAGILFDPDLNTGEGFGMFVVAESHFQFSYMHTEHTERTSREEVDSHLFLVDGIARTNVPLGDSLVLRPFGGVGVGLGVIDYEAAFDDEFAGLFDAKVGVEFGLRQGIAVGVSGGFLIYGYPGETVATGAYVTLGGSLSF